MKRKMRLDPWGAVDIKDYSKLFDEFGISPFEDILPDVPNPHLYMRRRIIFGHRDYHLILNAMKSRMPFAVMSGFMPSGRVHLGHKMVMDEIIWHQQMGGQTFFAVADMEAHAVRNVPWNECAEVGKDYILSLIALGFQPGGHIYFQSKSPIIRDLAFELGVEANLSELSAIYGFSSETHISHILSTLVQSADILHPQLTEFGGPKPVVIPVGADQDPHIRLTRDIANRMRMFKVEVRKGHTSIRAKTANKSAMSDIAKRIDGDIKTYAEHVDVYGNADIDKIASIVREVEIEHGGYGFYPPASTYHRFMSGLTGGKMSSSIPDSIIGLTESPETAAAKVKKAKTGGKITLAEQRRSGGEPQNCVVYELLLYHLIEDDRQIAEIFNECREGRRTCGKCKSLAAELMVKFLKEHQDARERARERLDEYGVKI